MRLYTDTYQTEVARQILAALSTERDEVIAREGAPAWQRRLEVEAIDFFVTLGATREEAETGVREAIAGRADPVTILEALVAKQRTTRQLGAELEVTQQMATDTSVAPTAVADPT